MTGRFASIELARLYETQGYLQDALSMYRRLEEDDCPADDKAEIRAAINRVDSALKTHDAGTAAVPDDARKIGQTLAELNDAGPDDVGDDDAGDDQQAPEDENLFAYRPEDNGAASHNTTDPKIKTAALLEKWVMLMVVRKRVNLFKAIRARL
ncbi:MAG: hypothetical protein V6Z89_15835 [Desulfobacter sp.]